MPTGSIFTGTGIFYSLLQVVDAAMSLAFCLQVVSSRVGSEVSLTVFSQVLLLPVPPGG